MDKRWNYSDVCAKNVVKLSPVRVVLGVLVVVEGLVWAWGM